MKEALIHAFKFQSSTLASIKRNELCVLFDLRAKDASISNLHFFCLEANQ